MKNKRFNIIDFVIVFVVVAALCVGGYIYVSSSNSEVANDVETIEFTIMVTEVSEDIANSFKVGSPVSFGESSSGSGVISDVVVEPYKELGKNIKDGDFVWSEAPELYTAFVTIRSDVVKSEYDYTSGRETVAIGRKMPFNAVGAASEVSYIVDLSEVE